MCSLRRLYWKTDKEEINKIIEHLNVKYLVGIYEEYKRYDDKGYPYNLEEWENKNNYYFQADVKYDGCIFRASKKTVKKELIRRGLIEVKSFENQDGETRYYTVDHYKDYVKRKNSNVKGAKKKNYNYSGK